MTNDFYVVGIGASAGGLEALLRLLPKLVVSGRMTYVIAQHMAKDGHSELVARLLSRQSSLPFQEAKNDEMLQPDRIYLIPSNFNGALKPGRISLSPPAPDHISSPSVNMLFTSIARSYGKRAIGIILSGTGSDGVSGCREIKTCGGRVIVQAPASAVFDGMPVAAIQAKVVDEIATPEIIADRLNNLFSAKPVSNSPANQSTTECLVPNGPINLAPLLQKILEATRIDFSSYKEETLLRRLESRLAKLKMPSFSAYMEFIEKNPKELGVLQHLFLVSLSSFFRDKESFVYFRQHIKNLVSAKPPGDPIRIWVPGCAFGEECYTYSIILAEILGPKYKSTQITIIGSDLNPTALAHARNAVYRHSAFKETDPEILSRYFEHQNQAYHVIEPIRTPCQFHLQDVTAVQPPESLDIISCRNLLIYMKTSLQDRLIEKFYEALRPEGFLFIGQSETIGLSGNRNFVSVDHYHKLYRRKPSNESTFFSCKIRYNFI